jgi:hypothetical protein
MSEQDAPMSKSKKKRLKKKQSKAKNSSGNESVASSTESINSQKQQRQQEQQQQQVVATGKLLTPQEVLRQSLLSKGFTANEIDLAMEEMWDKGLPYDEYDAVLKYLQRSDDDGKNNQQDCGNKETKQRKVDGNEGQRTTQTVDTEEDATRDGAESASESSSTPAATSAKAQKPPVAPKTSLAAKLEIVAGAENLTDAIFALTQWINKAAKPNEVSLKIRFSCDKRS